MDTEVVEGVITSEEIVNEAMQVALSKVINRKGKDIFQGLIHLSGVRDAQEKITDGQCDRASEEVLKFIFEKYPEFFDIGILLNIRNERGNPFKEGEDWGKHVIFLVRDKFGKYFVGSPANLRRKNFALSVYVGDSIEDVLSKMEAEERGPFQYWNFSKLNDTLSEMISKREQTPVQKPQSQTELPQIRWDGRSFHSDLIVPRK